MTTVRNLTAALLADRERAPTTEHNIVACFSCGRTYVYKGRKDELNGRFCSTRCRDWFDAGNPSHEQQRRLETPYTRRNGKPMRMGPMGFYTECADSRKEFDSKGLRCCSAECEKAYREREENLTIMAEAGIEPAAKRKCAAPGCDGTIPKWKNGRQVSARVTFCSPKCRQRAKRAAA